MLTGKYLDFLNQIVQFIPEDRIYNDDLRTLTYGTDASLYRLVPMLVVKVESDEEIQKVIQKGYEFEVPLTFRAAGTSLSGQALTDSVLVMLSSSLKSYEISEDGSQIRMQPALVGAFANLYLSKYQKKLGPDPASINSAMIGGIVANNASGMTSGTAKNTYNTLAGMKIIFADGSVLDTTDEESKKEFSENHHEFLEKIKSLGEEVKSNENLSERITDKFRMKNTCGYGINSLVDFEDPFDIITHLMVGSEGTLGYISEVTLNTVPELPNKATSLVLFKDIKTACDAIPVLQQQPVDATEIMDRAALKSVEEKPGIPPHIKDLNDEAAALLIETSGESQEELDKNIGAIGKSLEHLEKAYPIEFIKDRKESKKLWDVRKGLFPTVCKSRELETTVIIEDLNFPTEKLADAALDLQSLFSKHDYDEAIIWGHSLAGNLHFVIAQNFSTDNEIRRYQNFMDDITKLVIEKYDGSLKAEHGTGRNMAPFVKYEWGDDAYKLMKEIKSTFDPKNILNPGVLINSDPQVYLQNLKPMPLADEIVDKCIECGFCEVNCPSKDITLTPRQRIVAYREISRLKRTGEDSARLNELIDEYNYHGDETCATDGLCELSCPVDIDTGKLIKELRAEHTTPNNQKLAQVFAGNMNLLTSSARIGLNLLNGVRKVIGDSAIQSSSNWTRKVSGSRAPKWNKFMPKGADPLYPSTANGKDELTVVYFPSCINRSMGVAEGSGDEESQTTVMHRVLTRAGYKIKYPGNIGGLCCGMPFSSKGYKREATKKGEELRTALMEASGNGKYPVLFDMSPCSKTFKEFLQAQNDSTLQVYDVTEFIHDYLFEKLKFNKLSDTVALHPVCSVKKMELEEKLKTIAETCAENVIIPPEVGCCGFAGDRGFTFPELNESALRDLKPSLTEDCHEGFSTSRTCEIGLSEHGGIHYKSIIYLVDRATR